MTVQLLTGDNLPHLRAMADNSVDAIVCDPPYGLSFMGKKWDYDVPSVEVWAECLRVLKPGGYLLAFAGTRTQHRMAVNIEDAGFEIRDMIAWVYGSGFPKSLDVAKAIDAATGSAGSWRKEDHPGRSGVRRRAESSSNIGQTDYGEAGNERHVYEPSSEQAKRWAGFGTALKPAMEPITVARKPLIGTVAANVLAHGVGALNIDASRIPAAAGDEPMTWGGEVDMGFAKNATGQYSGKDQQQAAVSSQGRWPANLIHDGSAEVVRLFPSEAGACAPDRGTEASVASQGVITGERARVPGAFHGDSGSAARFFYAAKASRFDRNEGLPAGGDPAVRQEATMREREIADWPARNGNHHPTVKPTELMRYLVRLVTPPGGTVLDPFMGSGSTGKAAVLEEMHFIGIEREAEYVAIAEARIAWVAAQPKQHDLFGSAA